MIKKAQMRDGDVNIFMVILRITLLNIVVWPFRCDLLEIVVSSDNLTILKLLFILKEENYGCIYQI